MNADEDKTKIISENDEGAGIAGADGSGADAGTTSDGQRDCRGIAARADRRHYG
jgi:hypothetical protein